MIFDMTRESDRPAPRSPRIEARRTLPLLGAACVAFVLCMSATAAAIEPEDDGAVVEETTTEITYEYDYAADTEAGTIDEFRDELEPHGTWVDDPTYGTVWVPDKVVVGNDFQPYRTAGRWAVTDAGDWVWLSDYDWGYIPFHYGRWVFTSSRGWVWIPGRVYAPAWVVWRTGEPGYDYIGWAPAPPTYVWVNGFAVGYYSSVVVPWWYCPSAYFFHPHWHTHWVVDRAHIHRIHRHTHVHHSYHGHRHRTATGRPAHTKAQGTASGGPNRRRATASGGPKLEPTSGSSRAKKASASRKAASSDNPRSYAQHGIPKSPSFKEARVPQKSIPSARVKPNSKALSLQKPVSQKAKSSAGKARRTPSTAKRGTPSRASRSLQSTSRSRNTMFPRSSRANRSGISDRRSSGISPGRSSVKRSGPGATRSRSQSTYQSRPSGTRSRPQASRSSSRSRSPVYRSSPTRSRSSATRSPTRSRSSVRSPSRSQSRSSAGRSSSRSRSSAGKSSSRSRSSAGRSSGRSRRR